MLGGLFALSLMLVTPVRGLTDNPFDAVENATQTAPAALRLALAD